MEEYSEGGLKMTIEEAIKDRHSVRAYKDMSLDNDIVNSLELEIKELNAAGNLHMQLVKDEPKAFQGVLAKYGKFRNVKNYIVMAGKKADDLDERIGYYGEQLVLSAQMKGLNTCWVGLSYSKVPGTYVLNEDEVIRAYISIGYGETKGVSHKIKRIDQVSNVDETTPEWFKNGVEASLLAPTAVNQQKFYFEYLKKDDESLDKVRAKRTFSLVGFTKMDLGIAKRHFEIGAGKDNFIWAE